MKEYYYYWERRVYNAVFKMILRALVSFKALISQTATPGGKSYPLFQIRANYEHPDLTTNPTYSELLDIINLPTTIIATSKSFWRWMDGYCTFCPAGKGPNDEVLQKHTYFPEIEENKIIIKAKFFINLSMKKASDKARSFK